MSPLLLLLFVFEDASATCYALQRQSIRREVVNVVPQVTLLGCKILCTADADCQATLLNAAGTACVLLGAEVADPATNVCPVPFDSYVKTTVGCVDIPQGPIGDDYTSGECSRPSDVVGDLATDGNAIQHDGAHITLENYFFAYAVWDGALGSWYVELVDTPNGERYYFKSAKCVLAPATPLTPKCACAPLPVEQADPRNYNPSAPLMEVTPACPTTDYIQMSYLRTTGSKTWPSADKMISCMMGVWIVVRTVDSYNTYSVTAATCVE